VTTDWVLLDSRNRVVRIPEDFGLAFTNPEVKSEILRVEPPSGEASSEIELGVRPCDLDPLDHVNNAVYVDWLEEALEAAGWREATEALPRTYRLEYLASAARGDRVKVVIEGAPSAWKASIRRADGGELVRAQGIDARLSRVSPQATWSAGAPIGGIVLRPASSSCRSRDSSGRAKK
jgi:acyl-ACP thioesterase